MPLLPRRLPLALAATAVLLVPLGVAAVASTTAAPAAATPTFSHEVITDFQRSGFEPGIQVDSKDRLYTSVPYGFSDTSSFLWKSDDHGNSFRLAPASLPQVGKPSTCVGGGDSELALDAKDDLFFSDLQGLTNLSNSVTTDQGTTFKTGCTSAPNTPVDRMWYAVHGSLGDKDFAIYEEYDQVNTGLDPTSNNTPSNQLVETVSHDGVNFLPVVNNNAASTDCIGGGIQDCVTDDEGIPGNQVLSADGKTLYIAHTSGDSNKVVVSIGSLTTDATTGAVTADWKNVPVNTDLCPDVNGTPGPTEKCGSALFSTIAQDTAGNLYVIAASTAKAGGTQTSPYDVFLWTSTDKGQTWSKAKQMSSGGSNAFPWITAGDPGRVDATYYHATAASQDGKFDFDSLTKGSFEVEMAQSLNALDASPTFTRTTVSEHPVKYGPICTQGLNCTVSGGDRSLGDYLQVGHDATGAAVVAFVDDTSNAYSTGAGPTGQVANTGPAVVSRQVGGPSLFTSVGTVPGPGAGPATPSDTVSDPAGDAVASQAGAETPAGDNLDLLGTSLSDDGTTLTATMKVKDLSSLRVDPATGGTTGEWITRFTSFNGGATPGNGHIYYLGMESVGGGAPTFFAGDTKRTRLFMTYQQEQAATGSYDPATGVITVTAPLSEFAGAGGADALKTGSTLYSATGFTASASGPLKGNAEGLFTRTDATTPFNRVLGSAAAPAVSTSASSTPTASTSPRPSVSPSASVSPSPSRSPGLPVVLPGTSTSPSASASTSPAAPRPLQVGLSNGRITAGSSSTLTVTGRPGATVEVRAYTRPSTAYSTVRTLVLDGSGQARTAITPPGNTRLFARYTGTTGTDSPSVVEQVVASVSLQARRTGTRAYVFSGNHLPLRAGQLITLYRSSPSGPVQVAATRTGDGRTWSLSRTFTGSGTFGFYAVVGKTTSNDAGRSTTKTVRVR